MKTTFNYQVLAQIRAVYHVILLNYPTSCYGVLAHSYAQETGFAEKPRGDGALISEMSIIYEGDGKQYTISELHSVNGPE